MKKQVIQKNWGPPKVHKEALSSKCWTLIMLVIPMIMMMMMMMMSDKQPLAVETDMAK